MGRTGNAYAIATKDSKLKVLSLDEINCQVAAFLVYARKHPDVDFDVVAIGCGLAGYQPHQIAPMFHGSPPNVHLPKEFSCLQHSNNCARS
jgi:hypothetical protein